MAVPRTMVVMTHITFGLDDELVARLAARAADAGLTPEEMAAKLLSEDLRDATDADRSGGDLESSAFGYFDAGSSTSLRGRDVDALLAEGFGQ